MTCLAELAFAHAQAQEPLYRNLVRTFAALGRYAHQPIDVQLRMPISLLRDIAEEVDKLLREEAEAMKMETDG